MIKYSNQEQQVINAALKIIQNKPSQNKLSQKNGLESQVELQNYLRIRLACDKD